MRIEYHQEVQLELKEIRDFYESRSLQLGEAFVQAFDRQVLNIASRPLSYMVVRKDIRRCLMSRFPYVIFFRLADHDVIRITLVKHEKRHPAFGMGRK